MSQVLFDHQYFPDLVDSGANHLDEVHAPGYNPSTAVPSIPGGGVITCISSPSIKDLYNVSFKIKNVNGHHAGFRQYIVEFCGLAASGVDDIA